MTTPSNLYLEKLISEHPVAAWSLDEGSEYITKISDSTRDLTGWTITAGTKSSVTDKTAPFPSSYVTKIVGTSTPTSNALGKTYLSSASTFSSTSSGFTVSFFVKTTSQTYIDVGYGTGDTFSISSITYSAGYAIYTTSTNHTYSNGEYVTVSGTFAGGNDYDNAGNIVTTGLPANQFKLLYGQNWGSGSGGTVVSGKVFTQYIDTNLYPLNSWIPISFTLKEAVTSQKLLISFSYYNPSPEFYINGLTVGQDSEKFNGESFGQTLISLPNNISTTMTSGIETKSYGDQKYSAYYIGSGSVIYAKNTCIPMSFGSQNIMVVYPNDTANQPSFIFPGFGFLNQSGRYKELTIEALMRFNVNTSTFKRVLGPLASTDGLYINNEFVMLKVGNSFESFYLSEPYSPALYDIQIGDGYANLLINGDKVISMQIDNASLSLPAKLDGSSKSQDWIGIYAYSTSVPSVEVDSIAIYPYRVSETLAKRRFIYAQGVSLPAIFNSSKSQTVVMDYTKSQYTTNHNYPKIDNAWEQATYIDNFVLDNKSLAPRKYDIPNIYTTTYTEDEILKDIYETNVVSGESDTFLTLRPASVVSGSGRSWSSNNSYITISNYNPNDNLSSCIYGVFKSLSSSATDQSLIKIQNYQTGDYLQIILNGTTISYLFYYNGVLTTLDNSKTITTNSKFAVGINIQTLSTNMDIQTFFSNKSKLYIYVGGDTSLTKTFPGYIYKIGLSSSSDSEDILSLFDSTSGILTSGASQSTLLPKTATYTLIANNIFNTISLDIATSSYWQDYIPLSKLATTATNALGDSIQSLDMIQFNIDYPKPTTLSGSNYDTSASIVKTYITFQNMYSGANAKLSSFATLVSPNSNNVVDASTYSSTTKYEITDNTVIYPPTNVDLNLLAMVIHVEAKVPGINLKPLKLKYIQVAAKAFNATSENIIGTKYSSGIYPYTQTSTGYDYKSQNPYMIYKDSTPYLYLNETSGFSVTGTYSNSIDRGLYIKINEAKTPNTKIGSIQMFLYVNKISQTSQDLLVLESNEGKHIFTIVATDATNTKAKISFSTSSTSNRVPQFFVNGKRVVNPVVGLNEWNSIGIAFAYPVDVSSNTGKLKIKSTNVLINSLSFQNANEIENTQKSTQLLWSDIDGNNWAVTIPTQSVTSSGSTVTLSTTGPHNLFEGEQIEISGINPTTYEVSYYNDYSLISNRFVIDVPSSTSISYIPYNPVGSSYTSITTAGLLKGSWQYSYIPNYYNIFGVDVAENYKMLTGTNKNIIDNDYIRQGLRLGAYEYINYVDTKSAEITLDVL